MKTILKYFLAIQLTLTAGLQQLALAEGLPSVSEATENFEVKFASATYSVREIPAILKDLSDMDRAAGAGISKNMAKEIYSRLDAALSLMSLIMLDSKLSEKQKFELTQDLAAAIGEVMLTTYRIHGEDKVDKEKLTKRINEITTAEKAREALKEFFLNDMKNLVVPQKSARAQSLGGPETMWGVLERMNRNDLSQRLTTRLTQYAQEVYPKLEDGKLEKVDVGYWKEDVADVALRLREYRLGAQRSTAALYLGFAFWGFFAPHIDVVGPFTGYNDNTLFMSSLIYVSVWIGAALTKVAMTSTQTVRMLKDLITILENPNMVRETVRNSDGKMSRMTFSQKLTMIRESIGNRCQLFFGRKKKE